MKLRFNSLSPDSEKGLKFLFLLSLVYFEFFKQDQNNVDSNDLLVYEFEKTRVGTIKQNIKKGTLDKIGLFSTVKRNLKLNGDKGRHWWGKLSDVRLKERNISTPFCFPLDDPKKI